MPTKSLLLLWGAACSLLTAQAQSGCTDATACNYQAGALSDDGSCLYPYPGTACDCEFNWFEEAELLGGETTSFALEGQGIITSFTLNVEWENSDGDASQAADMVWTLTSPSGVCWSGGGGGCALGANWPANWESTSSAGYQIIADVPTGIAGNGTWTIDVTNSFAGSAGAVYVFEVNFSGFCEGAVTVMPGCTDSAACNFDTNATTDDGSCAVIDACGVCGGDGTTCLEVAGCTYLSACNFLAQATSDDGSCDFVTCLPLEVYGCTYAGACNFNADATSDDGTCEYLSCAPVETTGCTYPEATNYDAAATVDDGSCVGLGGVNPCPSDLNSDGAVSTADLLMFLVNFGTNCG